MEYLQARAAKFEIKNGQTKDAWTETKSDNENIVNRCIDYDVNTRGAEFRTANVSHAIGVSALPVLRNSIAPSWLADRLNSGTYSSPFFSTRPLISDITSIYSPHQISLPLATLSAVHGPVS